jgi:hypothetical protein
MRLDGLPRSHYVWSVQAIDPSYAGSAFSTNGIFTIVQATIDSAVMLPSGEFSLRASGLADVTYALETSTNLIQWTDLGAARHSTNEVVEIQIPPSGERSRFFRLRIP